MQGSKRKKVPGSGSHNWDSYLRKVLQDNHPGVKITKEAMQVWAEALDAWLQQLAQEIVQEHTSQSLTPANVQASLQLLLAKDSCLLQFPVLVLLLPRIEIAAFMLRCTAISLLKRPGGA
ncbi:TPA: hypothetical protein ACH3X3_011196 [Trebouxia sp. C0006]